MFYEFTNLNPIEVCFITSLWCNLPKKTRQWAFENADDFGTKNYIWMDILKSDKLKKKIDFEKTAIYLFMVISIETLEPNLVRRIIRSGLLDQYNKCLQKDVVHCILKRALFYDEHAKKNKFLYQTKLLKNHPLLLNHYKLINELIPACKKLSTEQFSDLLWWSCPNRYIQSIVKVYYNKQLLKEARINWQSGGLEERIKKIKKHKSNVKTYEIVRKYIKKNKKDPISWTPTIHQLYPYFVREAITTVLMISKLKPHCALYDLPNELVCMIYSKI